MANDEHGMPLPSSESPLPWVWLDCLTATGSEIHADSEFVDGPVGEIYVSDQDDRFVRHAVNNIIEAREIVRRLLIHSNRVAGRGEPISDILDDAARLWAKMQGEAGNGA